MTEYDNLICMECEYYGSCLHEDAHTNAKICPARANELKLKKEVERLQHNMNQAEGHIENKQVEIDTLKKEIARLNITESEIEAEEELEADEFNQLIAERDHLKKRIGILKEEIKDRREGEQKTGRFLRQEIEVLERQRDRAVQDYNDAHFEMHLEREYRKADEKKMNEYKARAIQLENENRTLAFDLQSMREIADGLKEGKCLVCEETDAANNEMRNKIIPNLEAENKQMRRDLADISKIVEIIKSKLAEIKRVTGN